MKEYSLLLVLAVIIVMLFYCEHREQQAIYDAVKSGERSLTCHMHNGERVIPPEMIVSFNSEYNQWFFTNGNSKTCKIGGAK